MLILIICRTKGSVTLGERYHDILMKLELLFCVWWSVISVASFINNYIYETMHLIQFR